MLSKLLVDKPALSRYSQAHISLILLGLMWVLPFLYYYHAYPLTTFYQEWGAALLGIGASAFLMGRRYWQNAAIPRIVLLPLLLTLLVQLQYLMGRVVYFDQALLFTLYMLWAALLMLLGQGLRERFGLPILATALAVFLLIGAELNALVGILQHYRWSTFLDAVVTHKNNIAVYGNLAQPNHYASYITMGLVSLGLLGAHLRIRHMVLLSAPLLFVLVLSGSRSSWFYLGGMLLVAFLWQRRNPSCRRLTGYSVLLVLGFVLMHWVVQIQWLNDSSGSVTTAQRMLAGETSGSVRLYLWHESWLMFLQSPWLGAGFGQFAWEHFQLAPLLQAGYISGLYNNAHNLIFQLAVETGAAGVLILLLTMAVWLWQGLRADKTDYHWWGYALLMVMGVHSMLEYPLWYAYFLGVAAILLGIFDSTSFRLQWRTLGRISVGLTLIMGLAFLWHWQKNYQILEHVLTWRPPSDVNADDARRERSRLLQLRKQVLLRPYAELYLNNWTDARSENLQGALVLNERALRFMPSSLEAYRRATLLAQDRRPEEACLQMERAIWAYPHDFPAHRNVLIEMAQKDPERFAALLEFAIEKNEEYGNAVSAR